MTGRPMRYLSRTVLTAILLAGMRGVAMAAGPAAPGFSTLEEVEQALREAAQARGAIDARYAEEERACMGKFFANDCVQRAREMRRAALEAVRPVEVEANAFKRRLRAERREHTRQERADRREADAIVRAQEATVRPQSDAAADAMLAPDGEEAARRAANVRDYERKARVAKARQRDVAVRKAATAARADGGSGKQSVPQEDGGAR